MSYNCKHVAAVLIAVRENIRRYGVVSPGAKNASGRGREAAQDELADWMEWARRRLLPEAEVDYDDEYKRSSSSNALLYLIHPPEDSPLGCWHCVTARSRRLKRGGWGKPIPYDTANLLEGYHPPLGWIEREDIVIANLIISLKAGGFGLNLTAADTVIHYDPWWNPAVESQATDRAHRIGQEKPVFVYKLIAANTVEERIVQLQEKKRLLAAGVYGNGQEAALAALTAEDLLGLLEV
jgi:hypothetical protein